MRLLGWPRVGQSTWGADKQAHATRLARKTKALRDRQAAHLEHSRKSHAGLRAKVSGTRKMAIDLCLLHCQPQPHCVTAHWGLVDIPRSTIVKRHAEH